MADANVHVPVESTLQAIEAEGDKAMQRYLRQFDPWDSADLTPSPSELGDIRWVRNKVRHIARIQCANMQYVAVETWPGVVLQGKRIPAKTGGLVPSLMTLGLGTLDDGRHRRGVRAGASSGCGRTQGAHLSGHRRVQRVTVQLPLEQVRSGGGLIRIERNGTND